VGAIDSEHLKLLFGDTSYPARNSICFAIPFPAHRIRELCQARFTDWECIDRSDWNPGFICVVGLYRREQVFDHWHCDRNPYDSVEKRADFE
jgi:hypothetical protein